MLCRVTRDGGRERVFEAASPLAAILDITGADVFPSVMRTVRVESASSECAAAMVSGWRYEAEVAA
jgi:hypothetical protein